MSFTLEHVAMTKGTIDAFELDNLLHPARAFAHPSQVVADPDLTLNEKRAILASWASDACAVEASPALREGPNGTAVKYDEIMEALRTLDGQVVDQPKYRKLFRRAEIFKKIAGDRHGGSMPLQ
jgi:hypothetical protein